MGAHRFARLPYGPMHRALLCLFLVACGPRLGPTRVQVADDLVVAPIVAPRDDPRRWYVHLDQGELGRRTWFLDTGYSHTTCDDDLVRDLGLEPRGRVVVRGEGGKVTASRARLPVFWLGPHRVDRLACVVRDLDSTSSIDDVEEGAIAGVLGSDLLRRFHVRIDPAEATLTLSAPRPAPEGVEVVRLHREGPTRPRMVVRMDMADRVLPMVVDTGATGSMLNGERHGLTPWTIRRDVRIQATGVDEVRDMAVFKLEGLTLGPLAFDAIFAHERAGGRRGLLGLDALKHLRIELDAKHGWARFEPVAPGPVPRWRTE